MDKPMTAPTPDARGLIERARSVAVGMRIRGERVPADMLEDLAAALEAATTPPPAATGDEALLGEVEGIAWGVRDHTNLDAEPLFQIAAALRQRGEELAARPSRYEDLAAIEQLQVQVDHYRKGMVSAREEVDRLELAVDTLAKRAAANRQSANDSAINFRKADVARLEMRAERDTALARVQELEAALSAATARAEAAPSPRQIYDLCLAIEQIPASPEQTAAVALASSLLAPGIRIDLGWDQEAIRARSERGE